MTTACLPLLSRPPHAFPTPAAADSAAKALGWGIAGASNRPISISEKLRATDPFGVCSIGSKPPTLHPGAPHCARDSAPGGASGPHCATAANRSWPNARTCAIGNRHASAPFASKRVVRSYSENIVAPLRARLSRPECPRRIVRVDRQGGVRIGSRRDRRRGPMRKVAAISWHTLPSGGDRRQSRTESGITFPSGRRQMVTEWQERGSHSAIRIQPVRGTGDQTRIRSPGRERRVAERRIGKWFVALGARPLRPTMPKVSRQDA